MISIVNNARIQALIACDTNNCQKENCLVYNTEKKMCDAKRTADMLRNVVYQKFSNVECYDYTKE